MILGSLLDAQRTLTTITTTQCAAFWWPTMAHLLTGGSNVDGLADLAVQAAGLKAEVVDAACLDIVAPDDRIGHPVPHADALHPARFARNAVGNKHEKGQGESINGYDYITIVFAKVWVAGEEEGGGDLRRGREEHTDGAAPVNGVAGLSERRVYAGEGNRKCWPVGCPENKVALSDAETQVDEH